MVELYWQALARDVPFANYSTSPVTQAAVRDLNRLSAFGGNVAGALTGPYISQFLWQPIPVNSSAVSQLYTAGGARYRLPADLPRVAGATDRGPALPCLDARPDA